MTDETDMARDDATLAAEYVVGLLEGEDLLMARGRAASDERFQRLVAEWEDRLAPLLDQIDPAIPDEALWAKIEAQIETLRDAQASDGNSGHTTPSNVVDLTARLRRWQWTAGISSAAAAIALAYLAFVPSSQPPAPSDTIGGMPGPMAAADPLVAQVPIGDTGLRLDVTYIPETENMLIAAIGLAPDGVHDHELWLVPGDGGKPQSLGVVAPGEVRAMELPTEITRNLADGTQLLLTREPLGGKPANLDAGPVVAQGAFKQV